jgi:hypothetical protein
MSPRGESDALAPFLWAHRRIADKAFANDAQGLEPMIFQGKGQDLSGTWRSLLGHRSPALIYTFAIFFSVHFRSAATVEHTVR